MPEKTFPGGRVGGRVVVLNENITTSAPNWAGVGAELGNVHMYLNKTHVINLFS